LDKKLDGTIIKGVAGVFSVSTTKGVLRCQARGLLKRGDQKLYVGDEVVLKQEKGVWYVFDVKERKNLFTRPYVSNVDKLLLVVSSIPEPDYILLDKLLVFCEENDVEAEIVVNKCDIDTKEYDYCQKVYGKYYTVSQVSAESGLGVKELSDRLTGNVCFAGQSAVGKTSLLNALCGLNLQVGGLSKIQRGRNTTRHVEIYKVRDDLNIYDTCGFSLLSLEGFDENHLALYYPDFYLRSKCKFSTCTHTKEPECAIKEMVAKGELDKDRYQRYLSIFQEMQELRKIN